MQKIEKEFYDYVQEQMEKRKARYAPVAVHMDQEVERNRMVNQNIQKVLKETKKRLKINKVSKEQHFNQKMKEFSNMDTFIDMKGFLSKLNNTDNQASQKNIQYKSAQSEEADSYMFDYAGIVNRSKAQIAMNEPYRSRPRIVGYLLPTLEKSNETAEQQSDSEQFYIGIDKLITDINDQQENQELDKKFEEVKSKQRSFLSLQQPESKHIHSLNTPRDEDNVAAKNQFREKSQKVMQLLEKTTKMLYSNKVKKPPRLSKKEHQIITEALDESRNHALSTPDLRGRGRKSLQAPSSLFSPNSSITSNHHVTLPKIPESTKQTVHEHFSSDVLTKQRTDMETFIQHIDITKNCFDKQYPNVRQIQRIQTKMKRNMNKIGKQPLESLHQLTKREFDFKKFHMLKARKSKPLQLI